MSFAATIKQERERLGITQAPVRATKPKPTTKMKLTADQIDRIQDAHQTAEKFQTVASLAAVVPGFEAFEITDPLDTEGHDQYDEDETYYQGSKLLTFEDEDGDEIELRIVGTYSIPNADAESGIWPDDVAALTEWEINEIL
jgi:hypothetical protein